jgi:enamine deaminase RidA (YjgF/YER057c/UK114 family)
VDTKTGVRQATASGKRLFSVQSRLLAAAGLAGTAKLPQALPESGSPTMRSLSPATIRPPFAAYSHGVEVSSGLRWVLTSGQLGIGPDDQVPPGARAQADLCFANCASILAEAGMGPGDVVRINAFVTDRVHMPAYMAARDAWLAGSARKPASTLVIVPGFTRAEFLVEVEVTAARA